MSAAMTHTFTTHNGENLADERNNPWVRNATRRAAERLWQARRVPTTLHFHPASEPCGDHQQQHEIIYREVEA